ncbi:MAG: hypothetical protein FWC43_14790 [Planctomycetaceae bacterium]|nr:hypothetical protein [Planctomycetaceae bacterium]
MPQTMKQNSLMDDFAHFKVCQPDNSETPSQQEDDFPTPTAFRLGIVGVGQCGNNMAAMFHEIGYRRVLAVNTAITDLESVSEPVEKLLIGNNGAGKNPEVGRKSVDAKTTKIRTTMSRLFEGKVKKIVVCMGLGGGTGSGGGPEVVKIAQDLVREWGGNPEQDVIAIATLPEALIEGNRVCHNALCAYRELEKLKVPRLYVDNAKMRKDVVSTTFGSKWQRMNKWVAKTFHEFNVYAAKKSELGVFDGQDMNDVLSRGRFIFSAIPVETLDDKFVIGDVIARYLERTLFTKMNLKTAEAAGCLMILNEPVVEERSQSELHSAFIELNHMMKPDSTLHRGIYVEKFPAPKKGDRSYDLICYVMLGGLDHPWETLEQLFAQAKTISEEHGTLSAYLVG